MEYQSCADCRTVADYKKRCYSNGYYEGMRAQKKQQHDQIKTELFFRERSGYEKGIKDLESAIIKYLIKNVDLTVEDVQKISYETWMK